MVQFIYCKTVVTWLLKPFAPPITVEEKAFYKQHASKRVIIERLLNEKISDTCWPGSNQAGKGPISYKLKCLILNEIQIIN